jgi:hypothetical protein
MRGLVLAVLLLASGCIDGGYHDSRPACPDLKEIATKVPTLPVSFGTYSGSTSEPWYGVFLADVPDGDVLVGESVDPEISNAYPDFTKVLEPLNASAAVAGETTHGFYKIGSDNLGGQSRASELNARLEPKDRSCRGPQTKVYDVHATDDAREVAAVGKGVKVYTAGFWDNGTLFYTNIQDLDHSDWPRAGWYSWEGGDALPVYVYGQDRSEEPAYWKSLGANYGSPGTPADAQAQMVLGNADTTFGLGYFTTIPGFNEALKGLSTSTTVVAVLEPQQGYTRAGNEAHPLYGDRLVFVIHIVDVVDEPCPSTTPASLSGLCDLP